MPLTREEILERKRIQSREYYEKNKQRINESRKERQHINNKTFYEKHKKELLLRDKEWSNTDKGRMCRRINNWKRQGMICEDWNNMYNTFINTNKCDYCELELTEGRGKNCRNLDHNHETGEIRGILCRSCNTKDVLAN